jgi:hypothetical protein
MRTYCVHIAWAVYQLLLTPRRSIMVNDECRALSRVQVVSAMLNYAPMPGRIRLRGRVGMRHASVCLV